MRYIATTAPRRPQVRVRRRFLGDGLTTAEILATSVCSSPELLPLCVAYAKLAPQPLDPLATANDALHVVVGDPPPSRINADIQACQKTAMDQFNAGTLTSAQLSDIQLACWHDITAASKQVPNVPSVIPWGAIGLAAFFGVGLIMATR